MTTMGENVNRWLHAVALATALLLSGCSDDAGRPTTPPALPTDAPDLPAPVGS